MVSSGSSGAKVKLTNTKTSKEASYIMGQSVCEKSAKVADSSLADTSPGYRIPNPNF